ncbi:MAG: cytidylate kinase-like family protein [Bacteroidales bacterium]|nr:cytidylate kinase-like family protein [Bacteroidales bacterium]
MEQKHILINIGRQFGAGGKGVAALLGERLGIPVYDGELLQKAAEESGFSPAIFRKSDEKRRLWRFGGLFGLNRASSYAPSAIDGTELFKFQSQAIRDLAQKGSAVFVGRASDYVLRDMECLDVFICAPLEDRVRRVCERTGMDAAEAEKYILRKEKARKEYYNFFTFGNWGVASNYDLCLDSSRLGIEGCAEVVIDFGRRAGLI